MCIRDRLTLAPQRATLANLGSTRHCAATIDLLTCQGHNCPAARQLAQLSPSRLEIMHHQRAPEQMPDHQLIVLIHIYQLSRYAKHCIGAAALATPIPRLGLEGIQRQKGCPPGITAPQRLNRLLSICLLYTSRCV